MGERYPGVTEMSMGSGFGGGNGQWVRARNEQGARSLDQELAGERARLRAASEQRWDRVLRLAGWLRGHLPRRG